MHLRGQIFTFGALVTMAAVPWVCPTAQARVLPDSGFTRSVSGQFIIHDQRRGGPSELAGLLTTNAQFASFDPTVLAVSSERLKQDVWRMLGIAGPGADKIHIVLKPASSTNDDIGVIRQRFRDAWAYRIELPDVTDRLRYVRAMSEVTLLDFANRGSSARSADIPAWLVEGVAQQLLASDGVEIILPPARHDLNGKVLSYTTLNARREDPLSAARTQLRGHSVATFADLSWPEEKIWTRETAELYRLSAQLFVNELLSLENGKTKLRQMLSRLPERYNWQIAFMEAFQPDFARLREVEKWWALRSLRFTTPDLVQTLSQEDSWHKLQATLQQAAEIRTSTNDIPTPAETNLQAVVSTWDPTSQVQALQSRVRDLELLRTRMAPAVAPVADGYRQALSGYLEQIGANRPHPDIRNNAGYKRAQAGLLERLRHLDGQFQALKPHDEPVADIKKLPLEPGP